MTFLIISLLVGGFLGGRFYEHVKMDRELSVDKRKILVRLSEAELRDELALRNRNLLLLNIDTGKEETL